LDRLGERRVFMFVRWNPFSKSRELISAQGMNIAGFEFGCAINVNSDCVQVHREATDKLSGNMPAGSNCRAAYKFERRRWSGSNGAFRQGRWDERLPFA
jgi:hypothetical protein